MVYRGLAGHAGYGNNGVYNWLYFGASTHSDGLLIGCALAFWRTSAPLVRKGKHWRMAVRSLVWAAAAVLAVLFVVGDWGGLPIEISVAVLASAVIVAGVVAGQTPAVLHRLLTSRRAVLLGRRSYGLYLWQYVLITTAQVLCAPYTGVFPVQPGPRRILFSVAVAAAAAASIAAAQLSYRYIELPALRLKRRFGTARPLAGPT